MVKKNNHAFVAMSGGVDSAVSALLTKDAGLLAHGVTMDLVRGHSAQSEPSADIIDAKRICDTLGIDHTVLYLGDEFERYVISEFINAYIDGKTPNPCVFCNKTLKFGSILDKAKSLGYDTVVTGHYANVRFENGRYLLCRAEDKKKDQSYVLWTLSQEQLSHVFFPLGKMTKDEVRSIAEENGFVNAHKRDSQDICFIPDGDYAAFIENRCGHTFKSGNFTDTSGNIIGKHSGIIRYTPGQRKGLGGTFGKPMYVKSKDAASNTVVLSSNDELFSGELTAHGINLISTDSIKDSLRVSVKIRYNHTPCPATVIQTGEDSLKVIFDTPQRAVASGQSLVMYDGDIVVGGGFID